MTRYLLPAGAGLLLGLLLGWLLFRGHPADPVILAAADSTLAAGKPAQAGRDTIRLRVTRLVADTAGLHRAQATADSLARVADSATVALATVTDSVPLLVKALHAQTRRADGLQAALGEQVARFAKLVSDESAYAERAEGRIRDLESSLLTTRNELAKARASGACSLLTASGGWSPLTGKVDIVLGGSCKVVKLAKAVF